jgi:iduronate 2-sulfatase
MPLFRFAVFLFAASLSHAEAKRPNVLFIVCDDLNTHVSTSGYPHIQTPVWDKLAAVGTTFRRAYCQYSVCGPSRASFLSGLYPESTGVIDNTSDIRETRPGTVTMPQAFKAQGYWTAATGKIFHNQQADHGDIAWDEQKWFSNEEMPIEAKARKEFEAKHGPITDRKNRKAWKEFLPTVAPQTRGQKPGYGPSGLTDAQHADGKNAIQASAWLENKSHGDKPFFIAVGIHKPHVPFLAPDAYFDLYPKEKLQFEPVPKDFWKQAPKMAMVKRYEEFGFELGVENDALRREYTQAYHACISFIDAQIGAVLDSLKNLVTGTTPSSSSGAITATTTAKKETGENTHSGSAPPMSPSSGLALALPKTRTSTPPSASSTCIPPSSISASCQKWKASKAPP